LRAETRTSKSAVSLRFASLLVGVLCALNQPLLAAIAYQDNLEKAVDPPGDLNLAQGSYWDVFALDQQAWDNNVYRISNSADVKTLIGPSASREDHINTSSAGADVVWQFGRQAIVADLRADYNRFSDNTNLNNVSTSDRLVWNWGVGSALSGQVGADYTRILASFVNATYYVRDIQETTNYYAGGRYQVGPRWALFGGFLGTDNKLSADKVRGNDSNQKSGEGGFAFYSNANDSFGLEYRYTRSDYPNAIAAAGSLFYPNYHEDRARAFVHYAFSDKTLLDVAGGWLRRNYVTHQEGDFSGGTYRATLQWTPTDKTQLLAAGWRELHAYYTASTDYFVSNGFSVAPTWSPVEKISLTATASTEKQDYVSNIQDLVSPTPPSTVPGVLRHDRLSYVQGGLAYSPIRWITLNFSLRHEHRSSNVETFNYTDTLAYVSFMVKFSTLPPLP
jgi:hypothetical protein